jgi:hypothetical protein
MTFGIGEVTDHETCGGLCWAHPARPAQALGPLERGLHIGNADVEDRVAVVVDAATDTARDPDARACQLRRCSRASELDIPAATGLARYGQVKPEPQW